MFKNQTCPLNSMVNYQSLQVCNLTKTALEIEYNYKYDKTMRRRTVLFEVQSYITADCFNMGKTEVA